MAYCTLADVKALNAKRTYDETSTPTSSQVETLINQVANEIDFSLTNNGYTVPITSPDVAVKFLQNLNALGAAGLAESAMFPEKVVPGETSYGQILRKDYEDGLKYLRDNGIETTAKSTGRPSSYQVNNPAASNIDAIVEKDMKF